MMVSCMRQTLGFADPIRTQRFTQSLASRVTCTLCAAAVEGAAADFDAAWEAGPELRPYLWQRGLTHYYLGRYEEAAAQFRRYATHASMQLQHAQKHMCSGLQWHDHFASLVFAVMLQ
jgi:hypothetical protein